MSQFPLSTSTPTTITTPDHHLYLLSVPMLAGHTPDDNEGRARYRTHIQFQHGPRTDESSTPGIFLDDVLACVQDQLEFFQQGSFACPENESVLMGVRQARGALRRRTEDRRKRGVLGKGAQ